MERKEERALGDKSEQLFQGIEIIAKGLISDLKFNKTSVCTIKDTKEASQGKYYVTDGTSYFYAYSENTDYVKEQQVYVMIPNGDYNNQKIITGKYLANENESYTYSAPFNSFVDITGNLYNSAIDEVPKLDSSLIANGEIKEILLWENKDSLKGYTTLGVKADFKSLLKEFNTVEGTYGLRIAIRFIDSTNRTNSQVRVITFTNEDMYGNPYNFETYYTQEKLFTIADKDKIIDRIQVYFFQDKNFRASNGVNIPVATLPNLFIKNVYVALGYDLNGFGEDQVLLYSLNSDTYDASYSSFENKKTMNIRWIHKIDDNNFECYAEENEEFSNSLIIHWYKYNLSTGVIDPLAGNFWQEIPEAKNKFKYSIFPNTIESNEQYKVIIESIPDNNIDDTELNNLENLVQEKYSILNDYTARYGNSNNEIEMQLLENARQEYDAAVEDYDFQKAQLFAETQYFESNVLTFTNESLVANYASIDLINGLSIECDLNGQKGIYNIYNSHNELTNSSEGNKMRLMTAVYNSIITGQESLDTAEKISWRFPLTKTMIQAPVDGKEYNTANGDEYFEAADGSYCIITRDGTKATGDIGSSFPNAASQYFRIKPYYVEGATDNIITCYVTKNRTTYTASTSLIFGNQGNSGTDFTFFLQWEEGSNCIYENDEDPIQIFAHLYDEENNEIALRNVNFEWVNPDTKFRDFIINESPITFCNSTGSESYYGIGVGGSDSCYIHYDSTREYKDGFWNILKATVKTGESEPVTSDGQELGAEVVLTAYLSIPLTQRKATSSGTVNIFSSVEGCNKIIYNSLGSNPDYFSGQYKIFQGADEYDIDTNGYSWRILIKDFMDTATDIDEQNHLKNYYPQIKNNFIIPPSMYFGFTGICSAICANDLGDIIWAQPIVIQQDQYSSALLNSWNGKYTVDEEAGTILTTMLGAGSKDERNRFSGVLLGDIDDSDKGVFGYHEGAQSFGFRTNGKAFIGKANKGRIEFDGNSGSIKSMSYSKGNTGMLIDLDDGVIDILGCEYASVATVYDSSIVYWYLNEDERWQQINEIYNLSVQTTEDFNKGPIQLATEQSKQDLVSHDETSPYYNKFLYPIVAEYYDYNETYWYKDADNNWAQTNVPGNIEVLSEDAFWAGVIGLANNGLGISVLTDESSPYYNKFYTFSDTLPTGADLNECFYLDNNEAFVNPNTILVLEVRTAADFVLGPVELARQQGKTDRILADSNRAGYNKFFSEQTVNDSDNNTTYTKTDSRVTIQALSPYIKVNESGKDVFQIAKDVSFIQTNDYSSSELTGARITLKGADDTVNSSTKPSFDIKAYSATGGVKMSSISPFLVAQARDNSHDVNGVRDLENYPYKTLLSVGDNSYYLQSFNYETPTSDAEDGTENTTNGKGMRIDLANGKILGYDFSLKAQENSGDYNGSYVAINSNGNSYLRVHLKTISNAPEYELVTFPSAVTSTAMGEEDGTGYIANTYYYYDENTNNYQLATEGWNPNTTYYQLTTIPTQLRDVDLINIGKNKFLLQSQNWVSGHSGTQINLSRGKITSYNFNLRAVGTGGTIFINSTNPTYPFRIEGNIEQNIQNNITSTAVTNVGKSYFRIKWNGDFIAGNNTNNLEYSGGRFTLKGGVISGGSINIGNGFFKANDEEIKLGDWHIDSSNGADAFYYGDWDSSTIGMANPSSSNHPYYLWAGWGDDYKLPNGAHAMLATNRDGTEIANLTLYGPTSLHEGGTHYSGSTLGSALDNLYDSIDNYDTWLARENWDREIIDHEEICHARNPRDD